AIGRLSLSLKTWQEDSDPQHDECGGNSHKKSQSKQRHLSAVIAFKRSSSLPQRIDLDVEWLRERASPRELWKGQRAIDLWHIRLAVFFFLSAAHFSTGRSSSFFEECLYRLRYNSASIIAL